MLRPSALPAASAAVLLAACQATAPPSAPPAAAQPSEATCGADKLADYLHALPSSEVLARIKAASGAAAIRVVGPHDAMTMDFRPDRLTIETGEDGRIERFRCV